MNKRDSRVTIDCGAVAKGYGVDCVARLLSSKGCTNYMVEIGGEVVVKGKNAKGKKWAIGINKPVDDSTKPSVKCRISCTSAIAALPLRAIIATSIT